MNHVEESNTDTMYESIIQSIKWKFEDNFISDIRKYPVSKDTIDISFNISNLFSEND